MVRQNLTIVLTDRHVKKKSVRLRSPYIGLYMLSLIVGFSFLTPVGQAETFFEKKARTMIASCQPIIADLKSKNRFKSCGGKPLGKDVYFPQTPNKKCKVEYDKFLEEVINAEKEGNTCNSADDCISEFAGVFYHNNKSKEPLTSYILSKKLRALYSICEFNKMEEFGNWVSFKDTIEPNHYLCQEHMCVPQYTGDIVNWSKIRELNSKKHDPDMKLFDKYFFDE